jgi:hypothetical protein
MRLLLVPLCHPQEPQRLRPHRSHPLGPPRSRPRSPLRVRRPRHLARQPRLRRPGQHRRRPADQRRHRRLPPLKRRPIFPPRGPRQRLLAPLPHPQLQGHPGSAQKPAGPQQHLEAQLRRLRNRPLMRQWELPQTRRQQAQPCHPPAVLPALPQSFRLQGQPCHPPAVLRALPRSCQQPGPLATLQLDLPSHQSLPSQQTLQRAAQQLHLEIQPPRR